LEAVSSTIFTGDVSDTDHAEKDFAGRGSNILGGGKLVRPLNAGGDGDGGNVILGVEFLVSHSGQKVDRSGHSKIVRFQSDGSGESEGDPEGGDGSALDGSASESSDGINGNNLDPSLEDLKIRVRSFGETAGRDFGDGEGSGEAVVATVGEVLNNVGSGVGAASGQVAGQGDNFKESLLAGGGSKDQGEGVGRDA